MFEVTLKQLHDNGLVNLVVVNSNYNNSISLSDICRNQGLSCAIMAIRCLDATTHLKDLQCYAVWCTRQVKHLLTDKAVIEALDVAEEYINGKVTKEQLEEAMNIVYKIHISCIVSKNYDHVIHVIYYLMYYMLNSISNFYASQTISVYDAITYTTSYLLSGDSDERQSEMFVKMCKGEAPWQVKSI